MCNVSVMLMTKSIDRNTGERRFFEDVNDDASLTRYVIFLLNVFVASLIEILSSVNPKDYSGIIIGRKRLRPDDFVESSSSVTSCRFSPSSLLLGI